MSEFSSGTAFSEGECIRGYTILKTLDPGRSAFVGMARSPDGRKVFVKKYRIPGGASPWFDQYVAYQNEIKNKIQADPSARSMCYEFIEFFEMRQEYPLRAFYQVFEWVDGGTDLRGVLDQLKVNPDAFHWQQRVAFARVMLAGVNAIHGAGIIHSDLKPENLYLIPDAGTVAKYKLRVIDLDGALLADKRPPWHGPKGGAYAQTIRYASPEHAGRGPVRVSDVFTCGLILGELLCGGHPCSDNFDLYDARLKSGGWRTMALEHPIPEATDTAFLEHVINASLQAEPERRPTAAQLLSALNGRLAEFDGRRPSSMPSVPSRPAVPNPPSAGPPRAPSAEAPSGATATPSPTVVPLKIEGGPENRLVLRLEATIGQADFKKWSPDFARFMAARQFKVARTTDGSWTIEHCSDATNTTTLDGEPLTERREIRSGMVVALGATGKCPLTLTLGEA